MNWKWKLDDRHFTIQGQAPATDVRNGCAPSMIILLTEGRQTPLSQFQCEVRPAEGNLDSGVGTFIYGYLLWLLRSACALRVLLIPACDCVTVTHFVQHFLVDVNIQAADPVGHRMLTVQRRCAFGRQRAMQRSRHWRPTRERAIPSFIFTPSIAAYCNQPIYSETLEVMTNTNHLTAPRRDRRTDNQHDWRQSSVW